MPKFRTTVHIELKKGILDPQGKTIAHALEALGFNGIEEVRTGKLLHLTIQAENARAAEETVRRASDRLLANPVIEDYSFEIVATEDGVQA